MVQQTGRPSKLRGPGRLFSSRQSSPIVSNSQPEVGALYSLIIDSAARHPEGLRACHNGTTLTCRYIDEQSSRFASELPKILTGKGLPQEA